MWLGLVVVAGAQAQDAPVAEEVEQVEVDAETGRRIQYKERTELEFEGLSLEGELVGPDAKMLGEQRRPRFPPMIELRKDWVTEMRGSIESVR